MFFKKKKSLTDDMQKTIDLLRESIKETDKNIEEINKTFKRINPTIMENENILKQIEELGL